MASGQGGLTPGVHWSIQPAADPPINVDQALFATLFGKVFPIFFAILSNLRRALRGCSRALRCRIPMLMPWRRRIGTSLRRPAAARHTPSAPEPSNRGSTLQIKTYLFVEKLH